MADIAEQLRSVVFRDPICVSQEAKLIEAMAVMAGEDDAAKMATLGMDRKPAKGLAGCLVVVNHGKVLGLLTAQDMLRFAVQQLPLEHLTLREVLGEPPMTVRESALTDLGQVLNLFKHHQLRYLSILDDEDRLAGLISHESLLKEGHAIARPPSPPPEQLPAELATRQQADITLHNLIEGTAATTGKDFFPALVSHIAVALQVSHVLVSELCGNELHVLAHWGNGALATPFTYALANTPCEQVLQDGHFYCEALVQQLFPDDLDLVAMEAESYLGIVLNDRDGHPIGHLCLLNKRPIQDLALAEKIISVFAARAAAELERERATRALEQLNQDLETHVGERTAALQASEERWQLALQGANDGIWDWNIQTNQLFLSQRLKEMRGFGVNELPDSLDACLALIHPDDRDLVCQAIDQHLAGRTEFFELEYRVQHQNGSYIWILSRAQAQRDHFGQAVRMIGSETDISQRKQAELALRDSERRYASLAAAAPVAIFRLDTPLHCIYVNDRWCEMTGRTAESAMGYGWLAALHPDDREPNIDQWIQDHTQARSDLQITQGKEARTIRPDGTMAWFYVQIAQEVDDDGNVVGYVGTLTDITDRKAAEQALTLKQNHLEALLNNIPHIAWIKDADSRFIAVNQPFATACGTAAEAIVGKTDFDIWPSELAQAYRDDDFQVLQSNQRKVVEEQVIRADGTLRWLETTKTPFNDAHGDLSGTVGIAADITDRKQTEIALKESQNFVQKIADASPNILYVYDVQETRNIYVNQEIATTLGYTPDMIQAMGSMVFERLMHPDDFRRVPTHYERINQSQDGDILEFEYRMRHANGEWRWLLSRDTVFRRDATGQLKQMIGAAQDITERKQAEMALEKEVLRRSAVFNASPDGIHILDRAGNLIEANAGFAQMLGYRLEEMSQLNVADWDAQWSRAELEDMLQNDIDGEYLTFETLHRRQDGLVFPVEIVKCSMEWNGEFSLVCISRDISERKQAELQLQRTNEELARATRLKDEFLANMSHELRTPLNSILGFSEALQSLILGPLNEKQVQALKTIENSGNHLLKLINDILDVAKIESGKIDLRKEWIDISYVCNSAAAFVKQQALKKNIRLTIHIPSPLPKALIDERRILQVLINLLNNAVKFTPEGGEITLKASYYEQIRDLESMDPQVVFDSSENQESLAQYDDETSDPEKGFEIAVSDTGIGISPDNIDRLFKPFVQIDGALNRKYEGTGLGLTLVKRIVELHGGTVALSSEVEVGSCFSIKLPFEADSQGLVEFNALPAETQEQQEATLADSKQLPLLLLAEDNESNVSMIVSYFEFYSFRLIVAKDGVEAIELSKLHHPSLILMDIQMPRMNGIEAMERIRQDAQIGDIPIIALTALAMQGDEERFLAAGANAYLSKPVKLKQLRQLVVQLLEPIN